MGNLPIQYVAVLWYDRSGVGRDKALAMKMAAIAAAESSLNPKAKGGPNSNGTFDHGLWQINDVHNPDLTRIYNPVYNASIAGEIYKKQGLNAWSAYGNELYKKNLDAVQNALKGQSWGDIEASSDYQKAINSGESAVSDINSAGDAANPIGGLAKMWDLTPVADFFRMQIAVVGVFALAMLLIVLGLYILVKPALPPVSVNPLPIKTK
jgi:hypothetical protein